MMMMMMMMILQSHYSVTVLFVIRCASIRAFFTRAVSGAAADDGPLNRPSSMCFGN